MVPFDDIHRHNQQQQESNNLKEAVTQEEESYSEEDEDSVDDDEFDQDDDDEGSSWSSILTDHWRQHALAIFVAILATAVTHVSWNQQGNSVDLHSTPNSTPTLGRVPTAASPHPHLDTYQRTANISFCRQETTSLPNDESARLLRAMDFHIPIDLLPILRLHYQADMLGSDDDYHAVGQLFFASPPEDVRVSHPQIDCLFDDDNAVVANNEHKLYHVGHTHYAIEPSVTSMYPKDPPREEAHLTHHGFAAKFVNLSPRPVLLVWDGRNHEDRRVLGEIPPFEALGTATTPGQSFSISPVYDKSHALARWVVTPDEAVLYYEDDEIDEESLAPDEQVAYAFQQVNRAFAHHYLVHSGRPWLANFPRPFPVHPFWPAQYFGQKHDVRIAEDRRNVQLKVVSVAPRVLTMDNFLTSDECDTLIDMAVAAGLEASTVYGGGVHRPNNRTHDRTTRSSTNTWLSHESSTLTKTIYTRAARVLQLDPELLLRPVDDDVHAHHHALTESLQVVRYKKGEEYKAHHDFVHPPIRHRHQPTRFATLLIYLNDVPAGGRTVFPRAVNRNQHEGVTIQPKKGSAALFYSVLPDGNLDDRSQHSSEPVEEGEKFIANLWVWEPIIN